MAPLNQLWRKSYYWHTLRYFFSTGQSYDADTQCKYLLFDNDARMDHTANDIQV
jgi:hypothetical protein